MNERQPAFIHRSAFLLHRLIYAAFAIFPPLMQVVQTFMRTFPPCGRWTRISCRLGLKRRLVRLFAWETLLPNCGPLPQTSHRFAMIAFVPPDSKSAPQSFADSHSEKFEARGKPKFIANSFTSGQARTPRESAHPRGEINR